MSKCKVVIHRKRIRENLLKGDGTRDLLENLCGSIADNAGDGYNAYVRMGKIRLDGYVVAETNDAYNDNLRNNTLLKAMGTVEE